MQQRGAGVRVDKTVFISYRRADEAWAIAIYDKLTHLGFDVFIDISGLGGGRFESAILEHIANRAHFLLLLTKTALDRVDEPGDWLRREAEYAIERERNVIPVMLPGFDIPMSTLRHRFSGKLATLPNYNGLVVPPGYLNEAIDRLKSQFLDVPLETEIHPMSADAEITARQRQSAAADAAKKIEIAVGPIETIVASSNAENRDAIAAREILMQWKSPWKVLYLTAGYLAQKTRLDPTIAAVTSIIILVAGIALRVVGIDAYFWLPSWSLLPRNILDLPGMRQASALEDTKFVRECAAKARAAGQRYLIISATESHKIEQSRDGKDRTVQQRIAYTLLPLVDIGPNDVGFDEEYSTSGEAQAWGGPFDETSNLPQPNRTAYHVVLNAKRGIPLTIMTGINKHFGLPYSPPRFQQAAFGADEDYYHYPNASDEICAYLAVFDSDSLVLSPRKPALTGSDVRAGALSLQEKNRAIVDYEPYKFGNSSFAMILSDFQPNQDAFVSWTMRPKTAPVIDTASSPIGK